MQGSSIKVHYTDNDYDQIVRAYIDQSQVIFNFLYVSFNTNKVKVSLNISPIYLFFYSLSILQM